MFRRLFKNWKAALAALAVVATGSAAAALAYAPYLPRLAFEGYPAETWPASGSFVQVAGAPRAPVVHDWGEAKRRLNTEAKRRFEGKEGRALLVYSGGRLELEHYGEGIGPGSMLNSYSMTKSLIGALVLRALADGRIASLQDPIGHYLPRLGDAEFRALPISAFLRMESGVVFEPAGGISAIGGSAKDIEGTRLNPFGPMARLHMQGLETVAGDLRTRTSLRGRYDYQNVNTAILGRLLAEAYCQPLEEILSEQIWAPAGAESAIWRRYASGKPVSPYCCLYATPRDWLVVGRFLINNGTTKRQFLPENLWRRFFGLDLTYEQIRRGRYGLHIYQDVLDRKGEKLQGPFSFMLGSRGQIVYMMPERDLVVVRFGGKIPLLHTTLYGAWRSVSE